MAGVGVLHARLGQDLRIEIAAAVVEIVTEEMLRPNLVDLVELEFDIQLEGIPGQGAKKKVLAEEEGFEPPGELPHQRFSRPPPSTARPFLHPYSSEKLCRFPAATSGPRGLRVQSSTCINPQGQPHSGLWYRGSIRLRQLSRVGEVGISSPIDSRVRGPVSGVLGPSIQSR